MKKLWALAKENFDTLIAILVGVVATIWAALGNEVNQTVLIAAISSILALLAFSIIRDRQSRDLLIAQIAELQRAVSALARGRVTAENFFTTRTRLGGLSEWFKTASTVDMMGDSLLSVSTTNNAALRDAKMSGAKIRLIVSNPENESLQQHLAMRHIETESGMVHTRYVMTSMDSIFPLRGKSPKGGSLHMRVTDQIHGFSYVGIDTGLPSGKISVEFYFSKSPLERTPIALVDAADDPHWFHEFKNQFESIWKESKEIF